MVMAVAITVIILAFLVSGYWINSDFKLERQGLLQISSVPTGADVSIDGDSSWLQRTNTSKVLSSGEHTVTLTKDGYDSWSKTVNISEGLLYRVHYPRLFPKNPVIEKALSVNDYVFSSISPDRNKLLLVSSSWQLIDLANKDLKALNLDMSQLDSDNLSAIIGQDATITSADWDKSGSHVLLEINYNDSTEWILLDIKDVKNSINLGKEFSGNFSNIQILDDSSSSLLATINGDLHKIDIPGRSISSVLVKDVIDYDHFDTSEVVFYAKDPERDSDMGYVGILKFSDAKITKLLDVATPAKVTISRFYDDKYIGFIFSSEDPEHRYRMEIYTSGGAFVSKSYVDIIYDRIHMYNNEILLVNGSEVAVYTTRGVCRFAGSLDEGIISDMLKLGRNKYFVITDMNALMMRFA